MVTRHDGSINLAGLDIYQNFLVVRNEELLDQSQRPTSTPLTTLTRW
ncbi:MAG: hypothetical protein U0514_00075 [Candidatus Andersenbacteria bacterium]